jgi:hypothetical protein
MNVKRNIEEHTYRYESQARIYYNFHNNTVYIKHECTHFYDPQMIIKMIFSKSIQ